MPEDFIRLVCRIFVLYVMCEGMTTSHFKLEDLSQAWKEKKEERERDRVKERVNEENKV
jgi:hypothetical protein